MSSCLPHLLEMQTCPSPGEQDSGELAPQQRATSDFCTALGPLLQPYRGVDLNWAENGDFLARCCQFLTQRPWPGCSLNSEAQATAHRRLSVAETQGLHVQISPLHCSHQPGLPTSLLYSPQSLLGFICLSSAFKDSGVSEPQRRAPAVSAHVRTTCRPHRAAAGPMSRPLGEHTLQRRRNTGCGQPENLGPPAVSQGFS